MAKLIKEFERLNTYGTRNALVQIGTRYTVAIFNPNHQNWIAGNAYGRTPVQAVEYATYATLEIYPTQKAATDEDSAYKHGG